MNDENYINNVKLYKSFLDKNSQNRNLLKPKCIIIGTLPSIEDKIDDLKDLYVKTMIEINKKYAFHSDQILFFPHPRMKQNHTNELFKKLSNYSKVQRPSSNVVENYLLEEQLELVVGSLSTALYYAKTIFGKNKVFYLNHAVSLKKKLIKKKFFECI